MFYVDSIGLIDVGTVFCFTVSLQLLSNVLELRKSGCIHVYSHYIVNIEILNFLLLLCVYFSSC